MTLHAHNDKLRVHTVAGFDLKSIQRIVGLPLSWVDPQPREVADDVTPSDYAPLLFDEPTWEPQADERTPLDKPLPDDISLDDHAMPYVESTYDGFPSDASWGDQGHVGVHAELERMADQILAAEDAGQLKTKRPMQVPGLPAIDEGGWRYRLHTYTLGFKKCPRCNGEPHQFGQKACSYCKAQGGWPVTRSRMTPWHPDHGFALTPPQLDKPVHTTHWRVRGEYYGDVRVRHGRPSESVMAEIRRRHFASTTRRELRKLAVKDQRAASIDLIAA